MLEKIIGIARKTGKIQMKYYKEGFDVENKNEDMYDFLTNADVECDKFIRDELTRQFPQMKILSEESKDIPSDYSSKVWMVDPIDGTKEFVAKNDQFAAMIGLCKDGIPILGVVYAPALDELYYAEKSKGAYLESGGKKKKLQVSDIKVLHEAVLIDRNPHGEERPLDYIVQNLGVKEIISYGSTGLKLGLIVKNEAHIHINSNFRLSKWDSCAPQVILEEAGGKVSDIYGADLDYKQDSLIWENSVVATNGVLHNKVIDKIKNLETEIKDESKSS